MEGFVRLRDVMRCLYSTRESESIRKRLKELPKYDVKPVVRGEWCGNGLPGSMLYGCSECGFTCGTYAYFFNYCPNCGATMKEGNHG